MNYEIVKQLLVKKKSAEYIVKEGSVCLVTLKTGEQDTVEILKVNNNTFTVGTFMRDCEPFNIRYKDIDTLVDIMQEDEEVCVNEC